MRKQHDQRRFAPLHNCFCCCSSLAYACEIHVTVTVESVLVTFENAIFCAYNSRRQAARANGEVSACSKHQVTRVNHWCTATVYFRLI
ncbi:unnamed protein product [Amoebophrya sp. A120]|nr:unnamed protein product [Amoebophrya sp. A120]CAD7974862.1 unnamed protein product [Amoebophrya sp. A120]|eukprot:GSA120T00025266001.1